MERKLYEAAYKGDIKYLKEITEQLNMIVTPNKNTILHVNIAFNCQPSSRFIEQVVEICPSLVIQANENGDMPLHFAAKYGRVAIVETLIKHARAQQRGLESGVTAVTQMLRMTNNDGNTALHVAVQNYNSLDMVKLFIREDPDFPYDSINNCGETPLYI
jgi:ankyrin repeat protein